MRLLLDTNRYSDLDRGRPDVLQTVSQADAVFLSFVTLAELHAGFRKGSRRLENEKTLKRFLSQPSVDILWPDARTVDLWADLNIQLRRQGMPIPTNDMWIAALALQHGLTLYARDAHFDHLRQVARL